MATEVRELDAVASVEDVLHILDELLLQEAAVDAKLESLLDPNNQLDLIALTTLQSTVNIEEQILQLNERIGPTAETASGLSDRVKKLDIEQARIKESLKYVEDVQELKVPSLYNTMTNSQSCVLGVYDAMEKQDWDEAATFLHQASLLDISIVNGPLAMSAVPTSEIPDPPTVYLSQASDALFKLFLREFDEAAKLKDEQRITRFFRLFPLIGKENEGLDIYGRFVCGIIAGRSRAAMTQCNFLLQRGSDI
jgi:conserved oligomeric Golgi complex subunit 4